MPSNTLTLRDKETPEARAFDISKRDSSFMLATGPISALGETQRFYRTVITEEDARRLKDWLSDWLDAMYIEQRDRGDFDPPSHPDFPKDFPGPQHG